MEASEQSHIEVVEIYIDIVGWDTVLTEVNVKVGSQLSSKYNSSHGCVDVESQTNDSH